MDRTRDLDPDVLAQRVDATRRLVRRARWMLLACFVLLMLGSAALLRAGNHLYWIPLATLLVVTVGWNLYMLVLWRRHLDRRYPLVTEVPPGRPGRAVDTDEGG